MNLSKTFDTLFVKIFDMLFAKMKFSVRNLLNLLRGCKSISYNQKFLNTLNRFNKTVTTQPPLLGMGS